MKNNKKNSMTSIDIKFYIILLIGGAVLILLNTLMNECEQLKAFLADFGMNLLGVLAAGILPAVVVAFMTDCASMKQKKKEYEKFYEDSVRMLKTMCSDLPATLHSCVVDAYPDDEKLCSAKKRFQEWCSDLTLKSEEFQIEYIRQDIREIKVETGKVLRNLFTYQAGRDIGRKEELDLFDALEKSCNPFGNKINRRSE